MKTIIMITVTKKHASVIALLAVVAIVMYAAPIALGSESQQAHAGFFGHGFHHHGFHHVGFHHFFDDDFGDDCDF